MAQKLKLRKYAVKAALFIALFLAGDFAIDCLLKHGLDKYFGLDRPAQVLCIGSSRTLLGVDDRQLEKAIGAPVVKYALAGANIVDRLVMIRQYLKRHPNSVRLVIYDVDAYTFTVAGLSSNSYRLFFPYIDDPEISRYLKKNCPSDFEYRLRRCLRVPRYDETTIWLALRGLAGRRDNLKRGHVDIKRLRNQIARGDTRTITLNPESRQVFEETIRSVRTCGAKMMLAYYPIVDVQNEFNREAQKRIVGLFEQYAAGDKGVIYRDYNGEFEKRHELFYDPIHLNPAGQKAVTARLSVDIIDMNKQVTLVKNIHERNSRSPLSR
jgi:hypothetical protein